MLVFLNKNKTISLEDILLIREEKNKKSKYKTVIITTKGKTIKEKNNIGIIIKRIEKQKGLLK